jgi:hypothetical protein
VKKTSTRKPWLVFLEGQKEMVIAKRSKTPLMRLLEAKCVPASRFRGEVQGQKKPVSLQRSSRNETNLRIVNFGMKRFRRNSDLIK